MINMRDGCTASASVPPLPPADCSELGGCQKLIFFLLISLPHFAWTAAVGQQQQRFCLSWYGRKRQRKKQAGTQATTVYKVNLFKFD